MSMNGTWEMATDDCTGKSLEKESNDSCDEKTLLEVEEIDAGMENIPDQREICSRVKALCEIVDVEMAIVAEGKVVVGGEEETDDVVETVGGDEETDDGVEIVGGEEETDDGVETVGVEEETDDGVETVGGEEETDDGVEIVDVEKKIVFVQEGIGVVMKIVGEDTAACQLTAVGTFSDAERETEGEMASL